MINSYFKSELKNEAVLEAFIDMRSAQPAKDQLHYFDKVMEGSTETNAVIFQKLYTDILSKSNLDYGDIPNSRGVLIKYRGYSLLQDAMGKLNILYEGISSDKLTTMNKLHDMIISFKKDYSAGFTYDVEMIKIIYNVSVLTLYELVNLCIIDYTKIMREKAKIDVGFVNKKKDNIIVLNNAKALVKMYENGQWNAIMREFQKNPTAFNGTGVATEASKFSVGGLLKAASELPNIIKFPVFIVAGIISLLVIVRGMIYWFYCGATKINEYIKTQKQFVDAVITHDSINGNDNKALYKHKKLSEKLSSIVNFIEVKILHSNKATKEKLAESNRDNFNVKDFSSDVATSTTSDFGLGGGNVEF